MEVGVFSQTAEYALRAMVFLAERPNERWTNQQIAAGTQVPAGYLAKVLSALARAQLVVAQRGRDGGFAMTRPAVEVNILTILSAVEPIRRIHKCPLNLPEHKDKLCPLHQRLDDAMAGIERTFSASTLEELVKEMTFPNQPPPGVNEAETN